MGKVNVLLMRYRTKKEDHGHISFSLPRGAQILGFQEDWHTDKGWQVVCDVLANDMEPREERHFAVVSGDGSNLTALGSEADIFLVGTFTNKGYASYLFETTQLSQTERDEMMASANRQKLRRSPPPVHEMGQAGRRAMGRAADRTRPRTPPATPEPPADTPATATVAPVPASESGGDPATPPDDPEPTEEPVAEEPEAPPKTWWDKVIRGGP